jgi:RNA polymerase sigma factor (sigma-70 family)
LDAQRVDRDDAVTATKYPGLSSVYWCVDGIVIERWPMVQQDRWILETIRENRARLYRFIRSRVVDPTDAEDILQDVFYELVEADRLMKPIEHVTGWLFRIARNRITDLFRRGARNSRESVTSSHHEVEGQSWEELLPSPEAGPEAAYARRVLLEELDAALDELPPEQREAFIAHEFMGQSFQEIAEQSGVNVNTLLSRKHYAVAHLRERLRDIYDEFTVMWGTQR